MPKFFQQFGIDTAYTAILEKALRTENVSCSHCGEVESRFMLDIFQCRSCQYQVWLILAVLFKNFKLPLTIDLARFDAVCQHQSIGIARSKLKYLMHFVRINIILMTAKTSLCCAYHAFNFNSALCDVLPFSSINLDDAFITRHFERSLFVKDVITNPRTDAWLVPMKHLTNLEI